MFYRPEYLSMHYDEYDIATTMEGKIWVGVWNTMQWKPLPLVYDPSACMETTIVEVIELIELMPWTIDKSYLRGYNYEYKYRY